MEPLLDEGFDLEELLAMDMDFDVLVGDPSSEPGEPYTICPPCSVRNPV
jgi:hypothetical protein